MVDADGDGPEWDLDYDAGLPAITVGDEGDYYATDAAGQIMPYDFQAGFMDLFAGKVIGNWTVVHRILYTRAEMRGKKSIVNS